MSDANVNDFEFIVMLGNGYFVQFINDTNDLPELANYIRETVPRFGTIGEALEVVSRINRGGFQATIKPVVKRD